MLDQQKTNGLLHHPLLFEMIRSFVVLAKHLNLSRAVDDLNSTRQTVRRHIDALEECMDVKLFEVVDRRYQLTSDGQRALATAQLLLAQGQLWLSGELSESEGLRLINSERSDGYFFCTQQQSADVIWKSESTFLRTALTSWMAAKGQFESPEMAQVRPYTIAYRDTPSGWFCVEVGEHSFYANWWGWTIARSSVGRTLDDFPGGPELATVMEQQFRDIQTTRGFRLDQVVTRVPRTPGGDPVALCYNRLLMGGSLPDGSFIMVVAVDRPESISISGLGQEMLEEMPDETRVKFQP